MCVDASDFRIHEPIPFDPVWFSHKFNGPALRYEMGVNIQTGHICWLNGPYPAGEYNDLEIFQLNLKGLLASNERVETDAIYQDDSCRIPNDFEGHLPWAVQKAQARARHETINGSFKSFSILSEPFRNSKHHHYLVVQSIAAILQSEILEGRGTYQIEYNIHRVHS